MGLLPIPTKQQNLALQQRKFKLNIVSSKSDKHQNTNKKSFLCPLLIDKEQYNVVRQ